MVPFTAIQPSVPDHWRAVILLGRNVAAYKFALGRSLLELASQQKQFVTLDDLAIPFARHICSHLQATDKQTTSRSSRFLDACRKFCRKEMAEDELHATTVKYGFANVIDAFHVVGAGEIGVRFFLDERKGTRKGIQLTDTLLGMLEHVQQRNLPHEIEARWRQLPAKLPDLPGANELRARACGAFDSLGEVMASGSIEEKRELIGLYVQTIKADPATESVQISLYSSLFNRAIAGGGFEPPTSGL